MSATCPVCRTPSAEAFFTASSVPVHCNRSWVSEAAARTAPRADMELAFCGRCGLVFNAAFEPSLVEYDGGYENALHYSPRFQAFERELIERLTRRYGLQGKSVVEIGCGDGHFLRALCAAGANQGLGYDPSYRDGGEACGEVRIRAELFSREALDQDIDLLACRHVLEHIRDPLAFLREVRLALAEHPAPVYFEVPNGEYMLRERSFWDVLYEHCSYFSAVSLRGLFQKAGFQVGDVYEAYEGEFLCLEAMPSDAEAIENEAPAPEIETLRRLSRQFGEAYAGTLELYDERLTRWHWEARRIALWGAGSKGVGFLNAVAGARYVSRVVDMNPRKQGTFVPGTGQRIVPLAALIASPPDIVLVANPVYEQEVRGQLTAAGLNPETYIV